jgi:hypothetical protein
MWTDLTEWEMAALEIGARVAFHTGPASRALCRSSKIDAMERWADVDLSAWKQTGGFREKESD